MGWEFSFSESSPSESCIHPPHHWHGWIIKELLTLVIRLTNGYCYLWRGQEILISNDFFWVTRAFRGRGEHGHLPELFNVGGGKVLQRILKLYLRKLLPFEIFYCQEKNLYTFPGENALDVLFICYIFHRYGLYRILWYSKQIFSSLKKHTWEKNTFTIKTNILWGKKLSFSFVI